MASRSRGRRRGVRSSWLSPYAFCTVVMQPALSTAFLIPRGRSYPVPIQGTLAIDEAVLSPPLLHGKTEPIQHA